MPAASRARRRLTAKRSRLSIGCTLFAARARRSYRRVACQTQSIASGCSGRRAQSAPRGNLRMSRPRICPGLTAMWTFAGKTGSRSASSHQRPRRREPGWRTSAAPASSAYPLSATASFLRAAIAGGTMASKKRGRRKCIVPVKAKRAARPKRESFIAAVFQFAFPFVSIAAIGNSGNVLPAILTLVPNFNLTPAYTPTADQPKAIAGLAEGLRGGDRFQTLLGATGTGKTFTMAATIAEVQRPSLVIAHNKTLAAQLCNEFREFFPENVVEYFVSYYDYYQPEAYVPAQDLYIEKDSSINDEIARLRPAATSALFARRDVIIVASVSCIFGIG